jgi:hypothetical protein
MKKVILLILALLLAIASTVGVILLLRLEFQGFEWGYGFGEVVVSLFAIVLNIINIVNLFAYAVCIAAWYGVLAMYGKVFGGKVTKDKPSYTKPMNYHATPSNLWNDLTDMQGTDDGEDKSYLYEDIINDYDTPDR